MRAYERFLNYVKVYTTSDDASTSAPSTARQFDLAHILVGDLGAADGFQEILVRFHMLRDHAQRPGSIFNFKP